MLLLALPCALLPPHEAVILALSSSAVGVAVGPAAEQTAQLALCRLALRVVEWRIVFAAAPL